MKFLHSLDIHQHPIQPKNALLQSTRMLGNLASLGGSVPPGLAFDCDIKVDELLGQGGHVVLEADGVFANCVGCEDVVALTFFFAGEEGFVVWVSDVVVYVE